MAYGGYMQCTECGEVGPSLIIGDGMNGTWKVCRCKRCSGLVSRLTHERDPATGEWTEVKSRPRCKNVVGFTQDDFGRACGSRALAQLEEDEQGSEYTMPCARCGAGVMRLGPGAIMD